MPHRCALHQKKVTPIQQAYHGPPAQTEKWVNFNMHTYLVLYCTTHLYSASRSAHQSEALPVQGTLTEECSHERTNRGTWLTHYIKRSMLKDEVGSKVQCQ